MSDRPAPAPRHLSRRAKQLWRSIAGEYMLEPHQIELLRRVCESSDRADEARELLKTDGLTTVDRYGQLKPHPAVNIERDARLALARLLRELALSPAELDDARLPRSGSADTRRAAR